MTISLSKEWFTRIVDPNLENTWPKAVTQVLKVGKNCIIGPYCAIGFNGFGIIRNKETGVPEQLPHYGGVVIGDNVRIGSCVCIDRGTKPHTPTTIGNNVMIDNLVHIAHNAVIGDGTIIVAGSVIGGSCKIGKNCFIGENVSIKQHLTIGDQVIIGAGSVVTKDIGFRDVVLGVPARSIRGSETLTDEERFRMVGY